MESTKNRDQSWLQVVREAFAQTDGSSQAMAQAIRGQFSTRPAGQLLAAAFLQGVTELAQYADDKPGSRGDAVDLEAEAVAVARRVVRPLLQAKMQARLDALDQDQAGATRCRQGDQPMESQGRRSRSWDGGVGPLRLKRRYSYCAACGKGRARAQEALGLPEGDFTPRREEVGTMMATPVPFGPATELVAKLCGIQVSVKAVEDMVERRAHQGAAQDHAEAVRCAPLDQEGLAVPTQERPLDAVPEKQRPRWPTWSWMGSFRSRANHSRASNSSPLTGGDNSGPRRTRFGGARDAATRSSDASPGRDRAASERLLWQVQVAMLVKFYALSR